ncbi:cysteine--tRNA ligase, cytoplasmic [Onthophagus taurus]|uniref:cysteine--tRNA ligase, cytoplasmic n=1 Tax=Onthophagus taurus TaxID=166361 RepID=UPI000C203158|nr:cysteine--tRNA ligase, cytoplasmic [Onthophagus taurus]
MAKRSQPEWTPYEIKDAPVLKLYNSLTRRKEVFVPKNGKKVSWYSCGPTVYDASHMGHARSYITFDILRRVLSDYFGYDILYVMNITDIDDKIIKRARQNYLYEQYLNEEKDLKDVLNDAELVMKKFTETAKATTDGDKKLMYDKLLERLTLAVENLQNSIKKGDKNEIILAKTQFLKECKDPLSDWLDSLLGSSVTENRIFFDLPNHWEKEFHKDMDALNVLKPHVLTRVSEYIPEIITYIQKIISNELGYEANGSVYFDVSTFDSKKHHHYAKLVPEAYGDTKSLQEGEGDLTTSEQTSEKKSPNDFALWKRSKAGEPAWDSPWGKGRPGWHIECSAMATAICGENLDIHTGGVDLKFPHHDNEIAQSEAYFDSSEWVKYFLHSGHLTIAGCKMSKSLKNFVTIQDALKNYTSRQLRFAFLLHSWKDTLDYSVNTMEIAVQYEKLFNEFFLNVKDVTRGTINQTTTDSTFLKWNRNELELNEKFLSTKNLVHNALCDNVDTRSVLETMRDLVTATNLYLRDQKIVNNLLLFDIAVYITKILKIFGTINENNDVGFPISQQTTGNIESIIMPYLSILAEFRDNIRLQAKNLKATDILIQCDKLRDEILPNVGVRLEDKEGGLSAVKLVDKETLLKEKEAKKQAELEKIKEKEKKKAEMLAAQAAKDALKRVNPIDMFKSEKDKYSKFDEMGLPTHDAQGNELSKGLIKKLQKLQTAQEKKYKEYLDSIQK